ncbi:unnamed protein product [Symbiodinium sp. CCMP2456]|nr:unnamed protein product [Symbiodinium sp. CCMP2456]
MSTSSSQMWWYKIDQQEAHFIQFDENDIVATVKEKLIFKCPSLQKLDPGQITIRKASGEALPVGSKISQFVTQGVGTEPETAVLVAEKTSVAAGVATHVAPTAAAVRLSLSEEAFRQVQPWQWIRCRISYRSTDAGIKSRLCDHMRQYTLGTLGGTVQRREDATVVTIEGTFDNMPASRIRVPRTKARARVSAKARGTSTLRRCATPNRSAVSGSGPPCDTHK